MTCAVDDKHDVKWPPTENEHSNNNCNRESDFTLFFQLLTAFFLFTPTNRHRGDFLSLLSCYLEYLTVRQTCDGQRSQAYGYVQKKNKTGREV